MRWDKRLWAVLFLGVTGCFPIELDVSKDGKLLIPRQEGFFIFDPAALTVRKVADADGESPVFARFSPNGKEILVVRREAKDRTNFRFALLPLAGGKEKEIYRASQTGYVAFSPDGSKIAISGEGDFEPDTFDRFGKIDLLTPEGGVQKKAVQRCWGLFRWYADSKHLMVFEIKKKDKNEPRYYGQLAKLDTGTGKSTALASAVITNQFMFDRSSDETRVLFTALKAGPAGQEITLDKESTPKLHELDLSTGKIRNLDREVRFATYSPSGKQALLVVPPKEFNLEVVHLEITDGELKNGKVIVTNAHLGLSFGGGDGLSLPGWINEKRLFYFENRQSFGTEGRSLNLVLLNLDDNKKKFVQPLLDRHAIEE